MEEAGPPSHLFGNEKYEIKDMDIKINQIVNIINNKLKQIKKYTSKEHELQILSRQGWPEKQHQMQPAICLYWSIRE